MKKFKPILLLFFSVNIALSVMGQGITTANIAGKVIDDKGLPLPAANVVAIHMPSNTQYATITSDNGGFSIPNMRVGGPYNVIVSYIGFDNQKYEGIFLNLNQSFELQVMMTQAKISLDEVVVVTGGKYVNSDLTGSMTNIEKKEIKQLPTIKRGLSDFTRLTPQSDGNSFGGRNNLYNNFSVDGSIFNNSFGLDYATPGGQTDAQPVSLEAIDQIQVSLAPFDVREGGFTGAGVNAVTKSGDNEFRANVYEYHRNQSFIGSKVGDVKVDNLDFMTNLFGASLGGPLVKDKLFFFMNYEGERRDELAHGFVADNGSNSGGSNVTSVLESDIKAVQQHLIDEWGYQPGAYQDYNHKTSNDKFLIKFNWNINQSNNLAVRYNMLSSWKDILPHPEAIGGRGPTPFRLPFENSSYKINNNIHSVVGELNSRFNDNISNRFLAGFTAFRDKRDPWSEPFPVIDILDNNGNIAITAGSEMFSTHNILDQNVIQVTDNITLYKNNHNLTGGFNFEYFHFYNSFNLLYYPWYTFTSVAEFLAASDELDPDDPNYYDFNADVAASNKNPYDEPEINVAQLAFYVQDEYKASDRLKLTLGLRVDIPMYLSTIESDTAITNFKGWVDENDNPTEFDPSQFPKSKLMFSPRLGFNYDVLGDRTLQLRGGTGVFTGRIPFVWLGNQATNSSIGPGYEFQINTTAQDFSWPQVWKSNLIVDKKFANELVLSVEGIFSKDINAVVHRNYNMLQPSGKLSGTGDDRAYFAGFNEVNIYSADPNTTTFLDAGAILLDNTNKGYQYSITAKAVKQFPFGLNASASYTKMTSKDYTSIPAEIAADAFQRNPVIGDPNKPQFSWSRYGLDHRFIVSATYEKAYGNMKTTVGAFYELAKGGRYSYTYAGDVNGDGFFSNNDLLYIPANSADINLVDYVDGSGNTITAADQWTALEAYINQDPYLKDRKGKYADRHGALLPWYSQLDLRLMQDFTIQGAKPLAFQLSIDILNFANMLNSSWGVRRLPNTTAPITVANINDNGDGTFTPSFTFDPDLKETFTDDPSILSKWQMQIGIKYMFNQP